ncbi:MAG: nidogen-like domain-containing protein, partial [Planctomycetota bacterium]
MYCGPGDLITVIDCDFTDNSAEDGGALYFEPNCSGTITDTTLALNEADEDGGAVYLSGSDIFSIAGCDISDNMAVRGAGIFAIDSPQATITGCTINNNDAVRLIITYEYWIPDPNFVPDPNDPNAEPPYIPASPDDPNFDPNDPNVRTVEHRDDSGIAQGGGIFSFRGPMSFADCQISNNTAKTSGGGVYLGGDSDLESPIGPELKNCLVSRNKAGRDGGGISCNWYVEPTLSNCTLAGNKVTSYTGFGGGLYCSYQSDVEVIDTIIWNNIGANGSQVAVGSGDLPYPLPSTVDISYSDLSLEYTEARAVWQYDPNQIVTYGAVRPGFDAYTLPANDDGSTGFVNIGFDMNFFGTVYPGFYINNNGNVTFDNPMWIFTPFGLTSNVGTRIVAPFFADVDTRTVEPNDPNNDSNEVTYGSGIVNGRPAFGINWVDVGYYYIHMDKLNSFQLIIIDRSDRGAGDFDMEFNYDTVNWETGDASLGENGFGGFSARAGFSNGSGETGTFYEFPGSGVHGAFLDNNFQTGLIHGSRNSTTGGRYIFTVEDGQPEMPLPASVPIYVEEGCAFTGFDPNDPNNPNGLEGGWVPAGN